MESLEWGKYYTDVSDNSTKKMRLSTTCGKLKRSSLWCKRFQGNACQKTGACCAQTKLKCRSTGSYSPPAESCGAAPPVRADPPDPLIAPAARRQRPIQGHRRPSLSYYYPFTSTRRDDFHAGRPEPWRSLSGCRVPTHRDAPALFAACRYAGQPVTTLAGGRSRGFSGWRRAAG